MKIVNTFVSIILIFIILAGCASIISKSEYPISISSQPLGADITIKNRSKEIIYSGKTPTTITLKAGAGFFKGEKYTDPDVSSWLGKDYIFETDILSAYGPSWDNILSAIPIIE